MNNIFFPTTIIDGFFDNPLQVRNFALNQQFDLQDPYFPGRRTQSLHKINQIFFENVAYRFLDLYFTRNNLMFNASMHFQLIDKKHNSGWIHKDTNLVTAIVYLNDFDIDIDKSIGTSLYDKKKLLEDPMQLSSLIQIRNDGFKKGISTTKIRNQYNHAYREVLKVDGLFNRALLFDSHLLHAAHNFIGDDNESSRLTLITFFTNISSPEFLPIPRIKVKATTSI